MAGGDHRRARGGELEKKGNTTKTETDLAGAVAAYYQELCGRDLPTELAEQLTRDYQQARLAALYGGSRGDDFTPAQAATLRQVIREELNDQGRRMAPHVL
jgi:hypothetical protein